MINLEKESERENSSHGLVDNRLESNMRVR